MPIAQITSDLVVRGAENNKRVNAPNPYKVFGLGVLIALGTILIWLLSPFGLIFIGVSLLRKFAKSNTTKSVSKIFQILFIIPAIIAFIGLTIIAVNYSQNSIVELWVVPLSVSLGLITVTELAVYFKQSKSEVKRNSA